MHVIKVYFSLLPSYRLSQKLTQFSFGAFDQANDIRMIDIVEKHLKYCNIA